MSLRVWDCVSDSAVIEAGQPAAWIKGRSSGSDEDTTPTLTLTPPVTAGREAGLHSRGEVTFSVVALKTHPAVFDALVVGTPNPRFGKQVTAVIQLREGMDNPGVEGLTEHCRGSLASYKMPRSVVVRSPIVRSPSGKPDYRWATDEALKDLE